MVSQPGPLPLSGRPLAPVVVLMSCAGPGATQQAWGIARLLWPALQRQTGPQGWPGALAWVWQGQGGRCALPCAHGTGSFLVICSS